MDIQGNKTTTSEWNSFYKISSVSTILMMVFFLFDVIIWIALGPYPGSSEGWFSLIQENRLVGLSLLSFPTLFGVILYYLTFLGLYNILKQVHIAYATLAVLLSFVGLTILIVTNMAYSMVNLSDQYVIASTEARKILLLTAGETQISTALVGFNMGGFLVEGAAVIFSFLMLKSNVFGKKTAYLGIIGHGLDLIRIIMILSFLPEDIGAILLMIGGLPQFIWLVIVGIKFFHLGQGKSITSQIVQ
jgi:hypothetical protein